MPDEYGGIELEDQWGGVVVEEEPQYLSTDAPPITRNRFTGESQRSLAQLAVEDEQRRAAQGSIPVPTLGQTLREGLEMGMETARESPIGLPSRAMAFVPRPTAQNVQDAIDVVTPGIPLEAPVRPPSDLAKVVAGGVNVARIVPESFTEPIGVATLGMGALPRLGQRAISAAFLADMAAHTPEAAQRAGEASVTGDLQEQVEAYGGLGMTPVMASAVGLHAFGRAPVIPQEVRVKIEQAKQTLPKAAAAAEEAVVKGQDAIQKAEAKAPVEEGTGVELRQEAPAQEAPLKPRLVPVLETASGKLYPGPSHTEAAEAARAKINSDFAEGKITREEFIKELTEVLEADEAVDTQHKMLDLNTGKTVEQGPGRVQSFNLDPKETAANLRELQDKGIAAPKAEAAGQVIDRINQLPVEEAVKLNQRPEMYRELGLKPEDAPALQKASDNAFARFEAFLDAGNEAAAQAEMGRGVFFNGAIEWANKKGPNYERGIAETAAPKEAPAPKLAAEGVGAIPENVPIARPAIAQEGVGGGSGVASFVWKGEDLGREPVIAFRQPNGTVLADPSARIHASAAMNMGLGGSTTTGALQPGFIIGKKFVQGSQAGDMGAVRAAGRVEPFFERESEAQGLGRSSLPPTVADVRAQRARDAVPPEPPKPPTTQGVPDTGGDSVKMRKSAERATTSPDVPEPVQERIQAAPESRYTQQSMQRVEEAVSTLPDNELSAIPRDSDLYTAARLEQAKRLFEAGKNDAGYEVFVELEKEGTRLGQLINQFKLLKGSRPENVVAVINGSLKKAGKDLLTPEQSARAIKITTDAKAADAKLDTVTKEWQENPTAENAAKAEAALDASNTQAIELQKFTSKFQPRSTSSILKSLLQGNLLTPISEVANIFGNMSFLPFRALDRTVASGMDMIDAALRNKPRELTVQPLSGTAEALKGVARGAKQIPGILARGTGDVIKGETRAGLHPIQAWINQFSKNPEMPTTGGKLTLKDRMNLALEGTFGIPAEAMLRGLGSGDAPFKEAARARVTAEQLKLNKAPRSEWDFAQRFPELFLPKEALNRIQSDTMRAVFQGESKTLNHIVNWAKSKGEFMDFLVATVAPYKLTPWNIVREILSYNPIVAATRSVYDAAKGNSRSAKLNGGKLVVGTLLTTTGTWLYSKGLLAPSLDERDEAQKARILSGNVLPPNHINISGLKRVMEGGDPTFKKGDETVDVFRAGGLAGSMFYMTANIGRDIERGEKVPDSEVWQSILRQSTLEQARFGMNQSFLSGVEGLLTAIKDGHAETFLKQWANTVASIPLPNTLNTISRSAREYKPDFSAKTFNGQIENMLRGKLGFAGLDDYLPLKRDLWGQPMKETPEGRNAIFYHFFDISKNKQVTSDPVELELYRLWRKSADSKVIPSLPQKQITVANSVYPLTPKLYEQYAEQVGTNRRRIVDALVINPNFHKLTDEQKMKILERAYLNGLNTGKMLFYQEHREELTPKAGRAGFRNE